MPIKIKVPEISEMSEDYQLFYRIGMAEDDIKKMWAINELDRQSCAVDVTKN